MRIPLNAEVKQFYQTGKYREAEPLYERALAIREKTLGPSPGS
jgi:Tetratricopeptide repeat